MIRRQRSSRRARQRGVSEVGHIMECGMVIGWFAICILGEKAVSNAADARRSAEDTAQKTASKSSGSYCEDSSGEDSPPGLPRAVVMPSVMPKGMPNAQSAVSLISSLGIGTAAKTFPYYVLPLKGVEVKSEVQGKRGPEEEHDHTFSGERDLGCLERTLDSPEGSVPQYRAPFWLKNLMGY